MKGLHGLLLCISCRFFEEPHCISQDWQHLQPTELTTPIKHECFNDGAHKSCFVVLLAALQNVIFFFCYYHLQGSLLIIMPLSFTLPGADLQQNPNVCPIIFLLALPKTIVHQGWEAEQGSVNAHSPASTACGHFAKALWRLGVRSHPYFHSKFRTRPPESWRMQHRDRLIATESAPTITTHLH